MKPRGNNPPAVQRPAPGTEELLRDLNPEQRQAVLHADGPLLVLAGAGSGKTRVITRRIGHLLSRGVAARSILAVTFTNKAAREMRERVADLVGSAVAKELTVSTFHSFCVRVLRQHAPVLGLNPKFTICDAADQLTTVKGALRELRIPEVTLHPSVIQSRISLFKNRLISPDQAAENARDEQDELVAQAYRAYDAQLSRSRVVDFDDLLLLTGRLLRDHPEIRRQYQERYRHILVDEYQDTNAPQYEILRLLAEKHRNLCVVGDDDQSIYGWRGADVRKILGFERDFKNAVAIRLETNYRSTEPILEAANAVIRHNSARHEKTLRAACGPGEPIRILEMEEEEHEAEFVVDEIAHEVRKGRARYSDFAILFRTQTQPRAFEARLRAAQVPYDLVGGMSFFDRKEVRDVLAYLRLAANPHDEASLLRVINTPPRGVGKTSLDRVLEFATREGISAAAAFDRAEGLAGVSPEAVRVVQDFRRSMAFTARRVEEVGLVQALREMLLAVNYTAEINRCYAEPVARQTRWAAVEEVVNVAENYVRRTARPTIEGFLEEVTLSAEDADEEKERNRDLVTLMTLHAAKGLEFPRVYLVGVEEGILPHQRSIAEGSVEEERRLMYVGITRARRHLTITRARSRAKYGHREGSKPSRFIFEIRGETPPFLAAPAPVAEAPAPKKKTRSAARRRAQDAFRRQ